MGIAPLRLDPHLPDQIDIRNAHFLYTYSLVLFRNGGCLFIWRRFDNKATSRWHFLNFSDMGNVVIQQTVMKSSEKCLGIAGKIFGHKFQPRYDTGKPMLDGSEMSGSARFVLAMAELSKPSTYVCDVCARCGAQRKVIE